MSAEFSVIEFALKQIGSSIQSYLQGNRAEIDKLGIPGTVYLTHVNYFLRSTGEPL